jgi:hypothetical protein
MKKVLFICKQRNNTYGISFGLLNSAQFVVNALTDLGITANVVEVNDNNGIDRVVTGYKPNVVIIEALWVVPEKFLVLMKLHPKVQWIVRIHSQLPFLANEGVAIGWIKAMNEISKTHPNLHISFNATEISDTFTELGIKNIYLPNVYKTYDVVYTIQKRHNKRTINIGCFGSIRPMKNQLIQAAAAIVFANQHNLKLNFHINSSRVEQKGENALKNIKALFDNTDHELVEHPWLDHKDFMKLVSEMDMGLQVSFSETFNIVCADFVANKVPIVVSESISWMPWWAKCSTISSESIVETMNFVWFSKKINLHMLNNVCLSNYNVSALHEWKTLLI